MQTITTRKQISTTPTVFGNTESATISQIVKSVSPVARKGADAGHEKITIGVEFKFNAPHAVSVAVAGTFNDWNIKKTPLRKDGDSWVTKLSLPRGRYEYRFVVDGKWMSDPAAKESIANPFGERNSVLSL